MPSLHALSTFALPAQCQQVLHFADLPTLRQLLASLDAPYMVLGGGSNTLFVEDYAGTVLLNHIRGIHHHEDAQAHYLRVGAGENWHALVQTCCQHGWHGMENLALIPGTVGAAPIQNIGAYGLEVGQFITRVEGVDRHSGDALTWSREDCQFGYRDSIFKHAWRERAIITHVNFELPKEAPVVTHYAELAALEQPTPAMVMAEVMRIRQAKLPDPSDRPNAGSFFKNPVIARAHYQQLQGRYPHMPSYAVDARLVKVPAAWLLDTLGFKGKTVNGVGCHATQPLVLVNQGHATGAAVLAFARDITEAVWQTFAISLEVEVQLIGTEGVIQI